MRYIKVLWHHDFIDEPETLYSELDAQGREVRKVEVFKDGTMGYAGFELQHRSKLAKCAMPTMAEIADDEQFEPYEISADEFTRLWEEARHQPGR